MAHLQSRSALPGYAALFLAFAGATVLFGSAIGELYGIWSEQPEYSYGILIPFLSAFLIWRDRGKLRGLPFTGSWYGLLLVTLGLALRLIGQLATMPAVVHYSLLLVLYGLILALAGPTVFRRILMPLLLLIFMVPLPPLFSEQLSLELQLVSSQIGVWVIQMAGISVFREGNIIDLGSYQLQVAEACSGLRYLFPLMTLSVLVAYTFGGPLWKRAIVFLSSIPLTVLMNSVRIGLIGITVDRWGTRMAEGLLHEFEGWVGFMICAFLVVLIALGLNNKRWSKSSPAAAVSRDAHSADRGRPGIERSAATYQADASFASAPRSFVAAAAIVIAGVALEYGVPDRPEVVPSRPAFSEFPSQVADWSGSHQTLEQIYQDAIKVDDYLLMNYSALDAAPVNFYVAYYASQRSGMSVHSPRLCLPGGGWKITSFEQRRIASVRPGASWPVNRVVIEQGGQRQLVYYWFRERDRRLTNEYIVRWYIFWDRITKNRTDGALVRLVAPIPKDVRETDIDRQLTRFALSSAPSLNRFVPD